MAEGNISIVSVHTPQTSFAIVHSFTQETLENLFIKLTHKLSTSSEGRNAAVGQGWVKYDWDDSVWNLDDGSDYTIFAWRLKSLSEATPGFTPTLYLHNPTLPLPSPPDYCNPAYYSFKRATSPPTFRRPNSRGELPPRAVDPEFPRSTKRVRTRLESGGQPNANDHYLGNSNHWPRPGEIAQIHGPVGKDDDRIAFILYKFLWNQNQKWRELVDIVEEVIPDLEDPGPDDVILKAYFLDLTKIPDWPINTRQVLFRTTRFLIRQEYNELDSYLDVNPQNHVILIGQPGIGKTVYLTYCLLNRLTSGKPTFFVLNRTVRYLFQESGVYWAPCDTYLLSRGIVDDNNPTCRTLFDLNLDQPTPVGLGNWPALVVSSPRESRYKGFRKENEPNVKDFYMKTWEWKEIYMCREIAINKRTLDEWRCAYQKYGGSARRLLTINSSRLEDDIAKAIANCEKLDILMHPWRHEIKDDVSHALVELNPSMEDGKIVREFSTGQIISQYIFAKILEQKKDALVAQMEDVFRDLLNTKATRSAAGILFEGAGHVYMFKSRKSPLLLRSLDRSPASELTPLDLSGITEIVNFTSKTSFPKFDRKHYYRPLSGTLPGIDSFALEEDACVVLFQYTVGDHHPTNPKFLYTLWEAWMKENKLYKPNMKWKLVFVVPGDYVHGFKKQPWSPTSEEKNWEKKVDQYVLGVHDAELWAAMREGYHHKSTPV